MQAEGLNYLISMLVMLMSVQLAEVWPLKGPTNV